MPRPAPSLVISCIALACSLGGVAWAAGVPHNSVGRAQIKRGAVDSSRVKDHSLRAVDLASGVVPPAMTGDLPAGVTLRGAFFVGHVDGAPNYNGYADGSISFGGFRLAAAPVAHVIEAGRPATAACPGSAIDPEAAPGVLCVYVADHQSASTLTLMQPGDAMFQNGVDYDFTTHTETPRPASGRVSRVGAHMWASADGVSQLVGTRGTWAVTAP